MLTELDELNRVVGTMPRDMVREVLNFARYLKRKHDDDRDWEDDRGSRFGTTDPLDPMDRWDAIDSPAGVRDVA